VRDLSASLIPLSAIGDQDADSNASCLLVVLSRNKDEETGVRGYRVALATRTTFVLAVHKDCIGIASPIRGVTPSIFLAECQRVRLNKAAPPIRRLYIFVEGYLVNACAEMNSGRLDAPETVRNSSITVNCRGFEDDASLVGWLNVSDKGANPPLRLLFRTAIS
jgi:hypothetical protein